MCRKAARTRNAMIRVRLNSIDTDLGNTNSGGRETDRVVLRQLMRWQAACHCS